MSAGRRRRAAKVDLDAWNRAHPVGTPVAYWPGVSKGKPLQGARSRLRAQGPVDEPHVKELKARAQELLAQVYPIRGTAPRDLVDTVRTSDYQALTRVIGQLEKQVQAAQERAARVGGGA